MHVRRPLQSGERTPALRDHPEKTGRAGAEAEALG